MAHTPSRKNAIRSALELKLRRAKGTRLQEFFAALMTKVYGDNFQSTSTDYSRGDLKCDGLLHNPLTIFACYGPVNAGASATDASMKAAVEKVESDLVGAKENWPELKEWKFVHNYVDPPAQIVQKIIDLRAQHEEISLNLFGKEQFEATLLGLTDSEIEELVGDAASDENFRALQPAELLQVVEALVSSAATITTSDDPVQVPSQKLHFNQLSKLSQDPIVGGLQNADQIATLLGHHQNPLLETTVAAILKGKYLDLKAQGFTPDDILFGLWEFVANARPITAMFDAAVWSLLAYFFERCTIFEDRPVAVAKL